MKYLPDEQQIMKPTYLQPADKTLTWLQYLTFGSIILYFGRSLFVPLSFAALLSFILYPVCIWLEGKKVSRVSAILMGMLLVLLLLSLAVALMFQQVFTFVKEWPGIQIKLKESLEQAGFYMNNTHGFSLQQQQDWIAQLTQQSSSALLMMAKEFLISSSTYAVLLILIPVFSALILYYRHLLVQVLFKLFPEERPDVIIKILNLTIKAYYNFIKGMLVVYLIVGVLNSVGLLLLGVPHAIFFGFTAAILTFIPYVGIMVGSLLPVTMAWITYNSIWYALGVVAIFAFVQYLEANLIFPLTVSNRLQINALATLVAILVGGVLWGVAGMILFIPFLSILKLIADNHPKMKTFSLLIGT